MGPTGKVSWQLANAHARLEASGGGLTAQTWLPWAGDGLDLEKQPRAVPRWGCKLLAGCGICRSQALFYTTARTTPKAELEQSGLP